MTDAFGWGDAPAASAEQVFADVEAFVRDLLAPAYRREVSPRGESRWDPAWWRDHADYHLAVLMGPTGPFARTSATTEAGEPLPCAPRPDATVSPEPEPEPTGAAS